MKSILPVILVILLLTGAITYVLSKNTLPKQVTKQDVVSPNELEVDSFMTPTPTATPTLKALATPPARQDSAGVGGTPTATVTPTPKVEANVGSTNSVVPTITLKDNKGEDKEPTTKGGIKDEEVKVVAKTKKVITKSIVCTPVYGAANTCVEHEVVDTAGENVLFFNLAGFSYLAGLGAFIKAKKA